MSFLAGGLSYFPLRGAETFGGGTFAESDDPAKLPWLCLPNSFQEAEYGYKPRPYRAFSHLSECKLCFSFPPCPLPLFLFLAKERQWESANFGESNPDNFLPLPTPLPTATNDPGVFANLPKGQPILSIYPWQLEHD
jgi:hypothetical protein